MSQFTGWHDVARTGSKSGFELQNREWNPFGTSSSKTQRRTESMMMTAQSDSAGNQLLQDRISALEDALRQEQRQHREAKQSIRRLIDYAPEAIVMFDPESGRFIDANPVAERMFGIPRDQLLQTGPFELSPPDQPWGRSRECGAEKIQDAIDGNAPVFEWWHWNHQRERFPCEVRLVCMPWQGRQVLRGTITDITSRKQLEICEQGRCQVLEKIARGMPLREALEALVRTIEDILAGMICSVLLLDRNKNCLILGAAPGLPNFYNQAIDGVTIGPNVGSCGAAAFLGRRVIANDVQQHPNWAGFRSLTEPANLRACWSEPILSLKGEVLGTFAIYYREPREPMAVELRVIEIAAQVAAIAIEHHQAQSWREKLNKTLEQRVFEKTVELEKSKIMLKVAERDLRLAAVSFETHDSILITDPEGTILRVNDSFTKLTGYSASEVIGNTPRMLRSERHDDTFYRQMWKSITDRGYWEGEIWNRRKNGEIFPQRLTITCVKDESGAVTHFIGAGQDITHEKQVAADQASIAVARAVQQNLFPASMPRVAGLDIAGKVFPADNVSGDYFDFLSLQRSDLGVVVADVTGHGLGPALLMAETQAYLRAMAEVYSDPGKILAEANRLLIDQTGDERFVTLFLAHFQNDSHRLCYASAGQQGYRIDRSGHVQVLQSTVMPLGVMQTSDVPTSPSLTLEPDDILVLPTDGIEESMCHDEELFGKERMFDVVRLHQHRSASEIVHALYAAARDFARGAPQNDDITVVIIKAETASA